MGHYDPGTSGGTPRCSQNPSLQLSMRTTVLESYVLHSFGHPEHGPLTQSPSPVGEWIGPHHLREIAQPVPLFLPLFRLSGNAEQREDTRTPVPWAVYHAQTPVSWTEGNWMT